MKKTFVLFAGVAFYLIACNESKQLKSSAQAFGRDYLNNPFVDKYKNEPGFISDPNDAMIYINEFKHHKHHAAGKKRMQNAWTFFDKSMLNKLSNDPDVDSIFFYLAAYPKSYGVDSLRKMPFVLMSGYSLNKNSKGDKSFESQSRGNAVFFKPPPGGICPPPQMGCKVAGAQ